MRQPPREDAWMWGVVGLVVGLFADFSWLGAGSGAGLGFLWGGLRTARARAERQDQELTALAARLVALESPDAPASAPKPVTAPPRPVAPAAAKAVRRAQPPPVRWRRESSPGEDPVEKAAQAVRDFFFGGNTVVRVGVLVLLVGVTLLGKWAVDIGYFPVGARLFAAALIGLALIAVGYRMRESRPDFGTTLQGGGIAALYLVVFFAFRIFTLLTAPVAFLLFVVVALACAALALKQSSQPLIFIGSLGGFLAPILAATGAGNHVVLFSYYLLLNLGIAAVSWRHSWRALNVLAFVSTYGVATFWGALRYRPEQFATTEPFVLAFLVLFTGIALVFALRAAPRLGGMVDGTLVFGTPLVTLLAQQRLLEGSQYGMAYSSAGLSVLYAALAWWLWRRWTEAQRPMAEAFVALAVVFGTIAAPLALDDGLSTTFVWGLEGAGLYWVGARQRRFLARAAGAGLQFLAAAAFAWGMHEGSVQATVALANPRFLACVALAFGGIFIGQQAHAHRAHVGVGESAFGAVLAGWGLLWWTSGVALEIGRFVAFDWRVACALVALAATAMALERGAARADWLTGRLMAVAAVPAAAFMLFVALLMQPHLMAHGGFIAWPICLGAIYEVLRRLETVGAGWTLQAYAPALWLVSFVVAFSLVGLADTAVGRETDWVLGAMGLGIGGSLLAGTLASTSGFGPFARFRGIHLTRALGPVALFALGWSGVANLAARGDAGPLPYLPILTPVDVSLAVIAVAVFLWWSRLLSYEPAAVSTRVRQAAPPVAGLLGFVWLNAVLVRSVYQWTDVSFSANALWDSIPLQVSFSIVWTLVALGGMVISTARSQRTPWLISATLLGVTVVKLFVVDLSQLSTGPKIVTFLVVGVLLLVVGYLSPVPPAEEEAGP